MFLKPLIIITILLPIFTNNERIITTLKYSKFRVQPTIVNGAIARSGQIPYLVSIKESIYTVSKNKRMWSNLCGGSIIGRAKVLTAAHCFESKNFYYTKHPDELRIVAGNLNSNLQHSGNIETTDKWQWRKVIHITVHNEFNFPSNDIAIVFINVPWNYTVTVNYITPARKTIDYPKSCLSAGYGQTGGRHGNTVSEVLLWAEIDVFSRSQCEVLWEMNMDTFICTNSITTDVAGGDSGGPLACYGTLDPTEQRNRDLLVGVVSGKNFDKSTLFTRVSEYRHWLVKNLGSNLKRVYVYVVGFYFVIKLVLFFIINYMEFLD